MGRTDTKIPSIRDLLRERQRQARSELLAARSLIPHATEKGDRTEAIWRGILSDYLPARYDVRRAIVADSLGNYSEQIDLVVHDRLFTPFIFVHGDYEIVPVEAVYAVFEVKQDLKLSNLQAAQKKAKSVRRLQPRHIATAQVPNPTASRILGGLLATQTTTNAYLRQDCVAPLMQRSDRAGLDFICVAEDALLELSHISDQIMITKDDPVAAFPIKLARAMQALGTVCPIDLEAYLSS